MIYNFYAVSAYILTD